jgi:hypothetical protein
MGRIRLSIGNERKFLKKKKKFDKEYWYSYGHCGKDASGGEKYLVVR